MDIVHYILNIRLLAAGKYHVLTEQYRKLKTDQERVVFTLNVMREYDIVPGATGMPKNAKESEKLRKQGNEVFVKGLCEIFNNETCIYAMELYTKSIAFAPYPSQQLALGYANRSAVLFQLSLYSECIQDIDRALALKYPDNLRAKLYLRKTECLMILGDQSVKNVLEETQHWLEKMSLTDTNREKLRSKLDVLHGKIAQTEPCTVDTKAKTLEPPLPTIESYNNEVPCASDAVAIKYNKHGRHVVATRDIRPGEVIAVEKPYSLILMEENMQTHCSNCLRVCWANIPCNYCTYAMYCSEECRNIEWKKCHDIECAIFPAFIEYGFPDFAFFSLRLAVLALREAGGIKELRTMLKEVDEHDDPRTKGFSQDGKLHSDTYISVYSLVTNTEKRSVSDLFKRSLDTSFILYYLATRTVIFGAKLSEDFSALAKNNDVTFFGSLILRHQQILSSNTHAFTEERDLACVERGIAAMPFFSLINHSCDPNILRQSRPEHIVIYAVYLIRKGEQLLDNYGLHYASTSKATRQQKLFEQHYFTCNCIPCQEDWPLYPELKSYKSLVKKPKDKAKIKKTLRKFNIYYDLATEGNVQNKPYIIEDLVKMVQVLHDCAPLPYEEMSSAVDAIRRVYNLNGNIFEIPQIREHIARKCVIFFN